MIDRVKRETQWVDKFAFRRQVDKGSNRVIKFRINNYIGIDNSINMASQGGSMSKTSSEIQHQMNQKSASGSKIASFYRNRSVLITGASGFIGKVLTEKLIRSCPEVDKIYVLIRPKWNKQPSERLEEILKVPLFDQVRHTKSPKGLSLEQRIVVVEGDVTEKNLGLSEENLANVIKEVSVIFHSAATVKFDEPLKQSIAINISGTRNLVQVCRKIHHLAALVHVSTAYANCDRDEIDEHIYPVDMDPDIMMQMAEWLDLDTIQEMKAKLLGKRPNTYTYTKALAEWWLIKNARDLPLAICRPSIVCASWKDPVEGWIDNVNGPTGIILGAGKGLIRSMYGDSNSTADLIPVDSVINMVITLGWFANIYHRHRQMNESNEYLSGSFTGTTSPALSSADGEDFGLISCDDQSDSNNNDENQDNHNRNAITTNLKSLDIIKKSSIMAMNNNNNTGHQNNNNSLTVDEGYGSISRSPDANSTISSTSDCTSSLHKPIKRDQTTCQSIGGKYYQLENISSSKLSIDARIRLTEQREAAYLESKLRQYRMSLKDKLRVNNLSGDLADIPVFHCTSGDVNPLTWGSVSRLVVSHLAENPSISTYRYPCGSFTMNKHLDNFYRITLHYIPAHIIDYITRLTGGRPVLVKIFQKFDMAADVLKAFTTRGWVFKSDNRSMLTRELMSEEDKKLFSLDITNLNWSDFIRGYVLGVRQYMLKEPLSNIEEARSNLRRTYYRNLSLQMLFIAVIVFCFFKA